MQILNIIIAEYILYTAFGHDINFEFFKKLSKRK